MTRFSFLAAQASTISVPCTLVSIVWTGRSMMRRTPTAADRCTVTPGYELGNQRPVGNAANPVRKASLADQAGEIRHLPSGKIVENKDVVAEDEEAPGQMRSKEPRAAGDQDHPEELASRKARVGSASTT